MWRMVSILNTSKIGHIRQNYIFKFNSQFYGKNNSKGLNSQIFEHLLVKVIGYSAIKNVLCGECAYLFATNVANRKILLDNAELD